MNHIRNADKILITVILLFAISAFLKIKFQDVLLARWIFVIMEAAVIGGIADWFAVSALFWKPFKIPFHTQVIPRNRDKVIKSIANMIQYDLLSVNAIKLKLERVYLVDHFVNWVDNKDGKQIFLKILVKYAQGIIEKLDPAESAVYVENIIKKFLGKLEITGILRDFANGLIKRGEDEKLIELLLDELIKLAENDLTKELIHEKFEEGKESKKNEGFLQKLLISAAEAIDAVNVSEAADAFHEELISTIWQLKDPDNDFRKRIKEMIQDLVWKLDNSQSWKRSIEKWKQGLVERIDLKEGLETLIKDLVRSVSSTSLNGTSYPATTIVEEDFEQSRLFGWTVAQIEKYWDQFKHSREKRAWVEKHLKETLYRLIEKEHYLIGKVVLETLEKFDNDRLNDFILDKVGEDLKWIRLNGSVVGGVLGGLLFIVQNGYGLFLR